jgi:hypothetical protein
MPDERPRCLINQGGAHQGSSDVLDPSARLRHLAHGSSTDQDNQFLFAFCRSGDAFPAPPVFLPRRHFGL